MKKRVFISGVHTEAVEQSGDVRHCFTHRKEDATETVGTSRRVGIQT